jgi:hypothetical protein
MMMELLRLEHLLDLVIFWSEKLFRTILLNNYLSLSYYRAIFFGAKELRIILIECPMVNMVELLKQ